MSLSKRAKAFSIDSILSSPVKSESDDDDTDKPTFTLPDFGDAAQNADVDDQVIPPMQGFEVNVDTHYHHRMTAWRGLHASNSTLFSSTSTLNSASSMTDIDFGSSSNLRRSSEEVDVSPVETNYFGSGYRFGALAMSDDSLNKDVPMLMDDLDDDANPISTTVNGITVSLAQSTMWRKFHECETEMIINRSGRRMFPCFAVSLSGLQPDAMYRISVTIASDNRSRYKFINGKWLAVGKADPEMPNEAYEHTSSPNHGLFWESNVVSFAKLKITNNKDTKAKNQIVLHSMHKYTPHLFIERLISDKPSKDDTKGETDSQPSSSSHSMSTLPSSSTTDRSSSKTTSTSTRMRHWEGLGSSQSTSSSLDYRVDQMTCISFPETSFVAVTAYQNDHITQLKIQNNPFAKAFRDAEVAAMLQGANMFSDEHHTLADYREREAFSSTHSLNAHMTGKRRYGLPIMQRFPAHLVPGHHQSPPMTRSLANVRADPNENPNHHLLGHDLHWKVSSATNLVATINEGAIHESCGFLPALSTSHRANSDVELSGKPRTGAGRSQGNSPFGGLGLGSSEDFQRGASSNLADDRRNTNQFMLRNPLFAMDASKMHSGSQPIIYPSQSQLPEKKHAVKPYHSMPWLLDFPQIIVSDTAGSAGQLTHSKPMRQPQLAPSFADDEMSTDVRERDALNDTKGYQRKGSLPRAEESASGSRKPMVPETPFPLTPHQRHLMDLNGGELKRRVTIHASDAFRQRNRDSPVMKPRRSLDSAKISASLYHFPGSAYSPILHRRSSTFVSHGSCGSLDEESATGLAADD